MKKKLLFLIFLQILFCNFLFAQTWNGSTSTDWNIADNWTPAGIPASSGYVTIPGGLTNYPKLASNVSITGINMGVGSRLDFNGRTLDITGNNYNYFSGATLNNSNGSSDIVINITSTIYDYYTTFNSTTVNDNITFNVTGVSDLQEAVGGGSANSFNHNTTFNMSSSGTLYLSYSEASQYKGNVSINRNGAGDTQIFNAGADITGNFSFSGNSDGSLLIGNLTTVTNIGGKIDINHSQTVPLDFQLFHVINQTDGGIINVQNSNGLNIQKDTLKVNTLSVTGFEGNVYSYFLNNDISGDITISNTADQVFDYYFTIQNNDIRNDATFINNSNVTFYESKDIGSGNHFRGNVTFTVNSTGPLYLSYGDASYYDKNLIVNRPGAGVTNAFNAGGAVGGHFSFTNNVGGQTTFGNENFPTTIAGKVNITLKDTLTTYFQMYRLINQTAGGIINVQNISSFNIQKDTLKVISMDITGFRGNAYSYLFDNQITGNINIANDVTQAFDYNFKIRNNEISGDANFTNNSNVSFIECDVSGSGNHYGGNVTFTVNSIGPLYLSYADASHYDGNLIVNRAGAGFTQAFNAGGEVGGHFSFTNDVGGETIFGNSNYPTNIVGKIDISLKDALTTYFQMNRIINQTTGGVIDVQNISAFTIQKDTLKVISMNVTNFRGNAYSWLLNNDITGNISVANNASQAYDYYFAIRNNNITGDADFTNNAAVSFYESDASGSGNNYTGDVAFNKNSTGIISVGNGDTTSIGGGLSLNNSTISLGKLQFTGNSDGIVQQAGSTTIVIPTLVMNKGGKAKITLMDSVKVTTNLNLKSGIIATGVNSNLVLPDNMTYDGGSDSSYVDGPILKIGNDVFTFPVGQRNKYAPVSITAPVNPTDQFRAQYFKKNPDKAGYSVNSKDAALDHVSIAEYWLLDRTAGTSDVKVTLTWADNRSGGINDVPTLRVARWDGNMWKNLGLGSFTGSPAMGTIQTPAAVNSFSPFTLASTKPLNPMPISISRFDASKKVQSVYLSWTTENEINFSHFDVERADGDNHFTSIGKVSAQNSLSMQYYNFEDVQPLRGVNLYRLKLVGADGKVVYSNVKSILFNANGTITIFPNPAFDFIQIDGLQEGVSIEIHDAGGKLIKRLLSNASNRYSVSDLRKGMYFLKVLDKGNMTVSKLIIQ